MVHFTIAILGDSIFHKHPKMGSLQDGRGDVTISRLDA